MADEEVEEEVETEEEEEGSVVARSHLWKHEAQVAWLLEEKEVDCDELEPAEIIALAYATRVEWRKSDTYRELVAEAAREKSEADAAKAERVAEAKAKREAAKREKDERKAKETAENQAKAKAGAEKASKASKTTRPAKKAAAKATAASKRRGTKATEEEDPFE